MTRTLILIDKRLFHQQNSPVERSNQEFPDTLDGRHQGFRRLSEDDPLCVFFKEPYARVAQKTDAIAAYVGLDMRGKTNILLHSPDTLRETNADEPEHRRTLARKYASWSHQEILTPDALRTLASAESLPEHVRDSLWFDGLAEGDSLRFFNHVAQSDITVSADLWPVLLLWLRDEINHRDGFRALYETIYGKDMLRDQAASEELSNFTALSDIMKDPFALLVSLMYDETATIVGYRKNMQTYRQMGPCVEAFVKRVNADEGWHFQKFLQLAARDHGNRVADIDAVIDLIAAADVTDYQRTFIFDRGEDTLGAKRFGAEEQLLARELVKRKFLLRVEENKKIKRA